MSQKSQDGTAFQKHETEQRKVGKLKAWSFGCKKQSKTEPLLETQSRLLPHKKVCGSILQMAGTVGLFSPIVTDTAPVPQAVLLKLPTTVTSP